MGLGKGAAGSNFLELVNNELTACVAIFQELHLGTVYL